jgi:hypothetical protein
MGCGTCVALSLEGGEKEAEVPNSELKIARRMEGNPIQIGDSNDADMIDQVTQRARAKAQIVMAMDNTLEAQYATQATQTGTLQFLATSRDYFENGTADTRVYQW